MDGRSWEAKIIPVSHSHNLYFPSNIPFSNFEKQWNRHLLTVKTNNSGNSACFSFLPARKSLRQKCFYQELPIMIPILILHLSERCSRVLLLLFGGELEVRWRCGRCQASCLSPLPSSRPSSSFSPSLLLLPAFLSFFFSPRALHTWWESLLAKIGSFLFLFLTSTMMRITWML